MVLSHILPKASGIIFYQISHNSRQFLGDDPTVFQMRFRWVTTALICSEIVYKEPPKGVSALRWWGLCDSVTRTAMPAVVLTTSRATHAGKVKG
jgi:hypothetical protein